ncbi:MAG: aspartyl protease family protein [Thermoanaerobaculia bacterium]
MLRDGEGARVLADRHIGPQHAGWTPIRVWRGDVLVDTRVNGDRSAWFLLDTGAQFNLLDAGLAAEIVQLKRYTQLGLRGFSGEVQEVYQAQQRVDLAFAGLQQGNDGILAMDLSGLSSSMGVEIGGVLGYEVLRHLDLAIDYRNALVRLRPR